MVTAARKKGVKNWYKLFGNKKLPGKDNGGKNH